MDHILFDNGPLGGPTAFVAPREVLTARRPDEIMDVLHAVDASRANGRWVAGFAAYEAGLAFSRKLAPLMPQSFDLPLLQFGVFDAPGEAVLPATSDQPDFRFRPGISAESYRKAFRRIKNYIAAGDTYQVNLTFPLQGRMAGDPFTLYLALANRQPVPHGAFMRGEGFSLLSRSPELFFRVSPDGRIETRPMKGTAPRGATEPEDAANRDWLLGSEKNNAENLMIVDLLRNDISRICEIGTVKVPELGVVETYETVHQMVSSVVGQLVPETSFTDIMRAMFPCGSITGAPKIRAMQIISELERDPRGVYCGSIGWIAPDGSMSFNVAIRTITAFDDGRARLNVGGGIVHDSASGEEYDEALLKAAFVTPR